MKIISKFKDFYDFIVQDHDADLNYVRQIDICHENYDDLLKDKNISLSNISLSRYHSYRNYSEGDIVFSNYIFGIYPYVYSQPIMRIFLRTLIDLNNTYDVILSKDDVDYTLENNDSSLLLKKAQKILDEHYDGRIHKMLKAKFNTNNIKKYLSSFVWKIDCPEIFYKIGAPVFTKYYNELFENGAYWDYIYLNKTSQENHYIKNISFQKLDKNILKYWYNDLFDLNTYINIENFLWSVKQEPISNPDNKTKIIAHGFDLKTSFRNVK